MLQFFRSRQWVIARRMILAGIILVTGFRNYGGVIASWMRGPDPMQDIEITRAEFRGELPGAKPGWIIGFRNNSKRFTYDRIELQATYMNEKGTVLETDKLVVSQKLVPGDEQIVGSVDFKSRGAATRGRLAVLSAQEVE